MSRSGENWQVSFFQTSNLGALSDVDFDASADLVQVEAGALDGLIDTNPFLDAGRGDSYAVKATGRFTLDEPQTVAFHFAAAGDGDLYIDGVKVVEVRADAAAGSRPGPCPSNGAAVCLCQAENRFQQDAVQLDLAAGEHTIELRYLDHPAAEGIIFDWGIGNDGRRSVDLSTEVERSVSDPEGDGEWEDVIDWPLVGVHAILTPDQKLLTYGSRADGVQGGEVIYDVWDYKTDTHYTLPNVTKTDIFCSVPALLPTTGQILLSGGDNRPDGGMNMGVSDANIFDPADNSLAPDPLGEMTYARWYPTAVTLANGSVVFLGGRDENGAGVGTPEIYTPGEGFRTLSGAHSDIIADEWWYPRAHVNSAGKIVIMAPGDVAAATVGSGGGKILVMDPTGNGSVEHVTTAPFDFNVALPSVMYGDDKLMFMADDGTLWSMDISTPVPTFEQVGDLGAARYWSNMLLLPNGDVLITGGSEVRQSLATSTFSAVTWSPADNSLTIGENEEMSRLYHSATILLPDATVMSLGGGASFGPIDNLNAQIFRPTYLFDEDGTPADRPMILEAPTFIEQNQDFTITVADPGDVSRITMIKHGSATHAAAMETRFHEPSYDIKTDGSIVINPVNNSDVMSPGAWMIFVFNGDGTPSHAATVNIAVDYSQEDNLVANGSFETHQDVTGTGSDLEAAGILGWTETNGQPLAISQGDAAAGVQEGNFALKTQNAQGDLLDLSQQISGVTEGTVYRLSFHVSADEAEADARFEVFFGGVSLGEVTASAQGLELEKVFYLAGGAGDGLDVLRFVGVSGTATVDHVRFVDALRGKSFPPASTPSSGDGQNLLQNGSFEADQIAGRFAFVHETSGWQSDRLIEIQRQGADAQAIEVDVNAGVRDSLYQDVLTVDGQSYQLSFEISGRAGQLPETSAVEVLWNGQIIGRVTPASGGARTIALNVVGTGGLDRLQFREADGASDDGVGGVIDDVRLVTSGPALRAAGQNLLKNGSFENDSLSAPFQFFSEIEGWQTDRLIELHTDEFIYGFTSDGEQSMEIDVTGGGRDNIYQVVQTAKGQSYQISFDIGAHPDKPAGSSDLEVLWNGQVVGLASPQSPAAQTMTFVVTGTGGLDRLEFREALNSLDDGGGGLIDDVRLVQLRAPAEETGQNLLENGSFENDRLDGSFGFFDQISGWQTDRLIELQSHDRVAAFNQPDGQVLEVDVNGGVVDNIYQNVATVAGQGYRLSFDIAAHDGALAGSSDVEVLWNGAMIASLSPETATAQSVSFSLTGTGGLDRLEFREAAGAVDDGRGGLIDDVRLSIEGPVLRAAGTNLLQNGSFEADRFTTPIAFFGQIDGWQTNRLIELQSHDRVAAFNTAGGQALELDVNGGVRDNVYQDIMTEKGQHYQLSFNLAVNPGTPDGSSDFEVLWNDKVVGSFVPDSTQAELLALTVMGTGGVDRLEFREAASALDDGTGTLIDDVQFIEIGLDPFV